MLPELEDAARDWQLVTDYLVALAGAVEPGRWSEPSAYPGWSNKDLLAHIATGYVVRIGWFEAAIAWRDQPVRLDVDAANAERIAALKNARIDGIIEELRSKRGRVHRLLERLRQQHLNVEVERSGPPPYKQRLGDLISGGLNSHDLEHAGDLKRTTGVSLPEPELGK